MRRMTYALLAMAALAATAQAQTVVQAPFVTVQTGGVVYVRAPFVNLAIPAQPGAPVFRGRSTAMTTKAYSSAGDLVPTVDVPPGVTPPMVVLPKTDLTPVLPSPTPVKAMTLPEFAGSFKPAAAGTYKVVLIHPVTCCPVTVCFTLPGCPQTVRLHDQRVTFHYGLGKNVILQFNSDGGVTVRD